MIEASDEFKAKVAANKWHDRSELDEVIAAIKTQSAKDAEWSWARNTTCKYVTLRFDMRDGAFVLLNRQIGGERKEERISLDQLKWQYSSKDDEPMRRKSAK